jgi:hypothetical protein
MEYKHKARKHTELKFKQIKIPTYQWGPESKQTSICNF